MKNALIEEIVAPLWEVHEMLVGLPGAQVKLTDAIDSVKFDLDTFIGDSLDPE